MEGTGGGCVFERASRMRSETKKTPKEKNLVDKDTYYDDEHTTA